MTDDLAVIENAFDRRERCADEKVHLVCQVLYLTVMLVQQQSVLC